MDAAFDDAGADGVAGEAGGVADVELVHQILAVFFDRLDADAQFSRYLLVGQAFGDQLKHLALAWSQIGGALAGWVYIGYQLLAFETLGDGSAEKRLAFFHFPEALLGLQGDFQRGRNGLAV